MPRSDDEGSTAATDGSTLRTSPAEAPGSAGSESNDSIGGVSGRSSAYGKQCFSLLCQILCQLLFQGCQTLKLLDIMYRISL